jgi:predicted membrane GTPase involved in stress response
MNSSFDAYKPRKEGEIGQRNNGSLISMTQGQAVAYAICKRHGLVSPWGANISKLLTFHHIYHQILIARVNTHHHTFINIGIVLNKVNL